MKNTIRIAFTPILCIVGVAHGAVVNFLAGPSDYGAATPAADYSLEHWTLGDDRQGQVPDCYFIEVEDAILHQRPAALSRNYEPLPDGTVNVTFFRNGQPITYHVTAAINTWWGDPYTGYDGANGDAAPQIVQKAFAAYRTTAGTIQGLGFGLPSEAMAAFGLTTGTLQKNMSSIINAFLQGDVVGVDTGFIAPPNVPADHSLSVWSVDAASMTAVIRNPWGDGYASDPEFVTINQAWLDQYAVIAQYGQFGGAAPAPEPASLATLGMGIGLLLRRKSHAA